MIGIVTLPVFKNTLISATLPAEPPTWNAIYIYIYFFFFFHSLSYPGSKFQSHPYGLLTMVALNKRPGIQCRVTLMAKNVNPVQQQSLPPGLIWPLLDIYNKRRRLSPQYSTITRRDQLALDYLGPQKASVCPHRKISYSRHVFFPAPRASAGTTIQRLTKCLVSQYAIPHTLHQTRGPSLH